MQTDATQDCEMGEDGAPLSDVEDNEGEPQVEKSKGFNVGEIIEGKREKKKVERLVQSAQLVKYKERLKVESGDGDKLGEIARINHNIGKTKAPLLKPLHKVLYDRPGAATSMKKNLRLFHGFSFREESDLYFKKMKTLSKYTNTMLKTICQVLDIERTGKQSVLIERIMAFLMHPVNTGKPVPIKKKKKKKRKNTATEAKKKTSKVSKSPTKSKKMESKSKAIVTDSSSDDDDDDDDDKRESKETKTSSALESRKKDDTDDSSEEEVEDEEDDDKDDDDDDEEEETPKSKSPAKKKPATPKKTASSKKTTKSTPVKKKPAAKKMAKEDDSDASDESKSDDSDNQNDSDFEKSKKKTAAKKKPAKPAPKTKKADSSSNKTAKKRQVLLDSDDSSDDDKPLIKMIKKPPTDDQIKTTVKDLLKDANLEEVTMKQLCQKVYDSYPEFDLTSRKDYIKQTVKSLIS
ncbi:protein DEK [Sardina pilchardus]|uniref:protein DEK n=1 Tax=Sardina pilchardus TaxID=27697 RepID=UPI002E11544F